MQSRGAVAPVMRQAGYKPGRKEDLMRVKKCKVKDDCEFCFGCGKPIRDFEYKIDLGSSGATFEFCRSCIKNLSNKLVKAIEPERKLP
jgi:hypothetical protein